MDCRWLCGVALSGAKHLDPDPYAGDVLPGVRRAQAASGDLFQADPPRASRIWCCRCGYEIFASGTGGRGRRHRQHTTVWARRYQRIVQALREGDVWRKQRHHKPVRQVVLLVKTGVFRGLKTVLHYIWTWYRCRCREPFRAC